MKLLALTVLALLALGGPAGQTATTPSSGNEISTTVKAIHWGFCGHRYVKCAAGYEAVQVARCETGGTFSVYARNGDYLGLFQQGSWSRSFGHWAYNAWAQADSAFRAWRANGFCWTCNSQWPVCGQGLD